MLGAGMHRPALSWLAYAVTLAAAAFVLEWLEYRYLARAFATEWYVAIIAVAFTGLGLWLASHLAVRTRAESGFVRDTATVAKLGISARELTVLEQLASGQSNKEIARQLAVSPNTIKTHVSRLFAKLGVERRTRAIHRARELGLIP